MKELRKRAGRALVALLQQDMVTALAELNVYKVQMEDGEPIITPGVMVSEVWKDNPHPLAGREMWAVGLEYSPGEYKGAGEYGMTHGPVPAIAPMLEVYAGDERACIFHFFGDGTEEITHRWQNDEWVPAPEAPVPHQHDNPFEN